MSRIVINDLKYNEQSSITTVSNNETSAINGGLVALVLPQVTLVIDNWIVDWVVDVIG